MDTREQKQIDLEPKPDDVLARIAVSASELAGVVCEGGETEMSHAIAQVLAQREQAA
ncbi:MAG: hypothetical protein JKY96_06570 [Phycisphaerales bacterium]|nr:hypothetical protein [Phycisphaerales bacterium]